MNRLSVIIITKNEARNIRDCLESVKWADEIIVLDSGSTDETVSIVREYTDKVWVTDWPGFGIQKQRALEKTQYDWVLSIDADERITPELRDEILKILKNPTGTAYTFRVIVYYLNRAIRFGDVPHHRAVRLFKKEGVYFGTDVVHEKLENVGRVIDLPQRMLHYTYYSVSDILKKMELYTTLSADKRYAAGRRTTFLKTLVSSFWAFFRGYVCRLGFLDGRMGFLIALTSFESSFYRHLKLLEHQDNQE